MENNKAFVQNKYSYTILHYKYRDENIFFVVLCTLLEN